MAAPLRDRLLRAHEHRLTLTLPLPLALALALALTLVPAMTLALALTLALTLAKVAALMQEMQQCGPPPAEIAGPIAGLDGLSGGCVVS